MPGTPEPVTLIRRKRLSVKDKSTPDPASRSSSSEGSGHDNKAATRLNMILGLVIPVSCLLLIVLIIFISCKLNDRYQCIRCQDQDGCLYKCVTFCNDKCCAPYNKPVQEKQYVRVHLKNVI
ncbi:uncharacterized protein LOC101847441 [Aplysia californica]|uniref:Uncharacterized protein LOC101847441 n=1 Tax=Aplysia californica TaxID=6500 RepID=A0ABM0JXU0_APLCA|nr:uncharacterized protein LOC101847441 [Aplysia californica]